MAEQHRSSELVFSLLVGVLGLTAVAVVVASILFFSAFSVSTRFTSAASPLVSPLTTIKAGAIVPAIALGSLAGLDDQAIVDQAVAAGKLDTALAGSLYSPALNDQARVSSLLSIAHKAIQTHSTETALTAVRTAVDVAILSPFMLDYGRAASLDEAGEILASLKMKSDAGHAYSTAATIAVNSGRIDTSYRNLLIDSLVADLTRFGLADQARSVRSAQQVIPPVDATISVIPNLLAPLTGDDSKPWTDLQAATDQRVEAAGQLVAALQANDKAHSDSLRQALEQALVKEDALRETIYTDGMTSSANLLKRAAYAQARMDWLALKQRIARQGFGMSLSPAWESQWQSIDASLSGACQDYYLIMRDVAVSLPDQALATEATSEVIRDQMKLGRLGFPPSEHEAELLQALDQATHDALAWGGSSLYVSAQTTEGSSQLVVFSR